MSSRGLRDVTHASYESRPDKLTAQADNAKRPGGPYQSSRPPLEDGFEPATPGDLVDRKRELSASTMDRGSLQKVVTTRMLDAEQRLRRALEQEGWTPSPRKQRHRFEYTPVRGPTPSPTSHQSNPHSMRGRMISPGVESKLCTPSRSETAECVSRSHPPSFPGRDQCQTATKQILPSVPCTQQDLSEEISTSAHPPESLHAIPKIEDGNSADASWHGKSIHVDCNESHDKESQSLHKQKRNDDSIIKNKDDLHSLQEHDITQCNNCSNPAGVQVYDHAAANGLDGHHLSLENQRTVGLQFTNETSSSNTSKQERVASLQHQEANQEYDSSAKLANQQHVTKVGTNLQSHVSLEIKAAQEPTSISAPLSVPQSFTMQQANGFLKIMLVTFNRLEHSAGYMCRGKLAHLVRSFVDSTMSISGDCASRLSRWKLSRWQAMIAIYIIALHVLVCYHVLQFLEHPHSGQQFYK